MILVADRVWNGVDARPIERGFVAVDGSVISAVGRAADLPSDAAVRDLGDATILPGLINAHVHITFSASLDVLDDYLREKAEGVDSLMARAVDNLGRAVDGGTTTVRDLGTLNDVVFAARAGVRDGSVRGPDIVAAGEGITSPGGHCYFFGVECRGVDDVRAAVRRQAEAGADVIKIFATGGNLTPDTDPFAPQYTREELDAAVRTAHEAGLAIAAHAHATEGIRRSAAARVDTIEHCTFEAPNGLDFDERTAEAIADAGIAAVPTTGISMFRFFDDPSLIDDYPEQRRSIVRRIMARIPEVMGNFRRMREMGVTVIAGSDAGIPNRTFEDFPADVGVLAHAAHGAGMSPVEALRAATSVNAEVLGLRDRGRLEPGLRADVLAVGGDPLTAIGDLTRTRLVLCAGRAGVDRG